MDKTNNEFARQREQLEEEVLKNQKMMFERLQATQQHEWLESDMTMPQFKILFLLYSQGQLRMSEIARALKKNISTATGIIDRLVEQHLIKREEDPEDRRVVIARLTDVGHQLCENVLQSGREQTTHLLKWLSFEELNVINQAMTIMARAALEEAHARMGQDWQPLPKKEEL